LILAFPPSPETFRGLLLVSDLKAIINGRGDEVVELAQTHLR
jgi:hypothetical protein